MLNIEPLSNEVGIPQLIVQSQVVDVSGGRLFGLGLHNTDVDFNNHVTTLPRLNALNQHNLLGFNLAIESNYDITINFLEPIGSLILVHPELIDLTF